MRPAALHLALLAAGLVSLAACRNDTPDPDDRSPGAPAATSQPAGAGDPAAASTPPAPGAGGAGPAAPADPDAAAQSPAAGPETEHSALGVLNAINEHEIAAARQALDKGVRGDVEAYARLMIDAHTRNRDKTLALQPDEGSSPARARKEQGERSLQALDAHEGDAYARAYLQAMVDGHAEALAMLDERLIPAATSPEVEAHLRESREHVAMHLEQARRLADSP